MIVVSVLGGLGYSLLLRKIWEGIIVEYHDNNEDQPRPLGTVHSPSPKVGTFYFECGGFCQKVQVHTD